MIDAVAILFVAAGVLLAVWWVVTNRPQRAAGFAASLTAILGGAVLLLRSAIAQVAVEDARTLEATVARATADAQVIHDLRAETEAKTASITARAAESQRLAAELRNELSQSEHHRARLDELAKRDGESQPRLARAASRVEPLAGSPDPKDATRRLSARQAEVLATSLRASGAHELTLTTPIDDAEAIEFAQRLKKAIEAGGWTVHVANPAEPARPIVGLEVLAPAPLPAHATTLLGALGRAGLQPKGSSRQQVDELEVLVGSKPGES
jgi:hypothetical protein